MNYPRCKICNVNLLFLKRDCYCGHKGKRNDPGIGVTPRPKLPHNSGGAEEKIPESKYERKLEYA